MARKYNVVMQRADGQTVEAEYSVNWLPDKVPSDEVAKCCAIEHTMKYGRNPDGSFKLGHVGISASLAS